MTDDERDRLKRELARGANPYDEHGTPPDRDCWDAFEEGRKDERARIVAWLRQRAAWSWQPILYEEAAALIEAGKGPEDVVA